MIAIKMAAIVNMHVYFGKNSIYYNHKIYKANNTNTKYWIMEKFIFMPKVSAFMHVPAINFTELKSVAKTKQKPQHKKTGLGAVARGDYCCLSAATWIRWCQHVSLSRACESVHTTVWWGNLLGVHSDLLNQALRWELGSRCGPTAPSSACTTVHTWWCYDPSYTSVPSRGYSKSEEPSTG